MVHRQDTPLWVLILFPILSTFMVLCYGWLPNPTVVPNLAPNQPMVMIEPTLFWDLTHWFSVAFYTPPFAYVFRGFIFAQLFYQWSLPLEDRHNEKTPITYKIDDEALLKMKEELLEHLAKKNSLDDLSPPLEGHSTKRNGSRM